MIRVGVVGATGRMGREVCRAVAADPELALVAAVSHSAPGVTLAAAIGLDGDSGALVLAAGIPRAFDSRDFGVVTLGYTIMRIPLISPLVVVSWT